MTAGSDLGVAASWGLAAEVVRDSPLAWTGDTGELPGHLASATGGSLGKTVVTVQVWLVSWWLVSWWLVSWWHLEVAGGPWPWLPGVAGQGGTGLGLQKVSGAGTAGGGGGHCDDPEEGRMEEEDGRMISTSLHWCILTFLCRD